MPLAEAFEPHFLGDESAHGALGCVKVPGHLAHGTFEIAVNPASANDFELRRLGPSGAGAERNGSDHLCFDFLVSSPRLVNENPGTVKRTANLCCRLPAIFRCTMAPRNYLVGEDGGMATS